MSTIFPYPIRFFRCRADVGGQEDWTAPQMQKILRLNSWVGGITGETGIPGLRMDFNTGLRLQLPAGNWHVRISDYDTERIFFDEPASETILLSLENYYVHWQVDIYEGGEPVFSHLFDPCGQTVCFVAMDDCALGDAVAFLPYIAAFREKYDACRLVCHVPQYLRGITHRYYPWLPLADHVPDDTYATYFFNTGLDNFTTLPIDGRTIPLHHVGMLTLGLARPAPRLPWKPAAREISSPYVCVNVQASTPTKGWIYPDGWNIVCRRLKSMGYRVLCIDKEARHEQYGVTIVRPDEAEDFTGPRPLEERADLLSHADFLIGLSSGLSWLANSVGCPVIMIGGFSQYWYEFPEAYRVYNRFVCHGCLNDVRANYFQNTCPRHAANAPDFLECSRSISPRQVMQAIEQLLDDRKNRCSPFA